MKKLSALFVIFFIIIGKITAQTWTSQNDQVNMTYTVISSVERFEELLKQYTEFYSYYSVAFFPKEEIETMLSDKNSIISGEKPATTTGLFVIKISISSDVPKLQADYLKNLGVEHSPWLLRLDPQKGGILIIFYNEPSMEDITGGMKTLTNYGALLKFYKNIFN